MAYTTIILGEIVIFHLQFYKFTSVVEVNLCYSPPVENHCSLKFTVLDVYICCILWFLFKYLSFVSKLTHGRQWTFVPGNTID